MTKSDLILIFLLSGQGRPVGAIELQKGIFLIQQNLPDFQLFDFSAGDYGPVSISIYEEMGDLVESGQVFPILVKGSFARHWAISLEGAKRAKIAKKPLSMDQSNYIKSLGNWIRALSFKEIVSAVKREYPRYFGNSVFQEILENQ